MTHKFTTAASEEFILSTQISSGECPEITGPMAKELRKMDITELYPTAPLCERTVRACIEALPGVGDVREDLRGSDQLHGAALALGTSRRFLTSLLPKPDRAKELVDEWEYIDPCRRTPSEDRLRFLNWLLTEKGAKL